MSTVARRFSKGSRCRARPYFWLQRHLHGVKSFGSEDSCNTTAFAGGFELLRYLFVLLGGESDQHPDGFSFLRFPGSNTHIAPLVVLAVVSGALPALHDH